MRFALLGGESLLVQCGERLLARGHTINAVVTEDQTAVSWAEQQGLRRIPFSGNLTKELAAAPFDWLLSIVNVRLLSSDLLRLPVWGAVNFHDGPLPRYGGRNATNWAILGGESEHGVTWHRMEAEADTGDILVQRRFALVPADSALTLNAKCFEAAIESFDELLNVLDQKADGRPQTLDRTTYRTSLERPAGFGLIDWSQGVEAVDRLARALDFGGYRNPLCCLKLWLGDDHLLVERADVLISPHDLPSGTLIEQAEQAIAVAAAGGIVRLSGFTGPNGLPASIADALAARGVTPGARLPLPDTELLGEIDARCRRSAGAETNWMDRLSDLVPAGLNACLYKGARQRHHRQVISDKARQYLSGICSDGSTALGAAAAMFVGIAAGRLGADVAIAARRQAERVGVERMQNAWTPLRVEHDARLCADDALRALAKAFETSCSAAPFLADLWTRTPGLRTLPRTLPVAIVRCAAGETAPVIGGEVTIAVRPDGCVDWHHAAEGADLQAFGERFDAFLDQFADDPMRPVGSLHALLPSEGALIDGPWRSGDSAPVTGRSIQQAFEAMASRQPSAVAVVFEEQSCTFESLNRQANQLARRLRLSGAAPDQPIGICVERSLDLLICVLGVLKSGAAYVPLDPSYPPDRLAYMIEDSRMTVAVTQEHLSDRIPSRIETIFIDRDGGQIRALDPSDLEPIGDAGSLAYLIYTSGSTGRPKGVMIEHRNVLNFFDGLDLQIGASRAGVWLSVTSLSFDISVLELLWTLTRGFKVVIHRDPRAEAAPIRNDIRRPIDFSLFYFSASGDAEADGKRDKYRLLLEGARFADEHSFKAVWTPERHFHAFGGLYPNPSVTGAAVAAITRNVSIRAGSCVLPLHHPARVVEEWSVVDNLSNGRVGLSIAAGWQPDDFVLRPESFADAKAGMFRDLDTVRRLWRGESISMPGPRGQVNVRCLPRPVQAELPIWVTTAGNIETFEAAGKVGAGVLTHLLGQSVPEIRTKIAAYRQARREAGYSGEGCVSLMLHTFVGDDTAEVKEIVREPMKAYLKTSVGLIKNFASAFPTFKRKDDHLDFNALSAEEFDSLLDYSFERYFETSGLFGDLDRCSAMVEELRAAGVDEIACLVDFGVDAERTLAHLKHLNRLRRASEGTFQSDHSIEALIVRHQVTHLQCTPSMASMLLASEGTRTALQKLELLLVGGEALTKSMMQDLLRAVPGRIFNMYGPTETTIWSTCAELSGGAKDVSIGRPLLNTDVFVLDEALRPLPPGVPGELCIGGAGVSRGYWQRPELTRERFVSYPRQPDTRLYRTGDRVSFRPDGSLDFIGRLDSQVKVRGHRVELGEIESVLSSHVEVAEAAVVIHQESPDDVRIIAYAVLRIGTATGDTLKAWLKTRIPGFMLPAQVVLLPAMPRTPNQKIDRKALAARREAGSTVRAAPAQAAASELERSIASVWQKALRIDQVGLDESFFDLGGHSLLAVHVHGQLRKDYKQDLSITDIFRFPTVRKLAGFIAGGPAPGLDAPSPDRGAARRAAMASIRRRPVQREKLSK